MTACGSSGGRWVTIAEAPAWVPSSPMTHPNETLVRDAYRAFNEGDIDDSLLPSLRMLSSTAQMVRLGEEMQSGRWSSSYAL